MGKKFDSGSVLERLRDYFGVADNAALGKKLGVSKQAVSNWKARNTLDFPLILEKCPEADLNLLFRGTPFEGVTSPKEVLARLEALEKKMKAKGK